MLFRSREFTALGLAGDLHAVAIENQKSRFYNRFGQLLYREPRGRHAGYRFPELGIHRGRLHLVLFRHARQRLGAARVVTDRQCVRVEQDAGGVMVHLRQTSTGTAVDPVRADIAIACDGIHSAVRKQFYPDERVAFSGINTWRGVTRRQPILGGRTYLRVGSIRTGKMVIYPIVDDIDGSGRQLVNWMAEIQSDTTARNDWNRPGRIEDFLQIYQSWKFDWLDVPEMVRAADTILEYPMVDKDPVDRKSTRLNSSHSQQSRMPSSA